MNKMFSKTEERAVSREMLQAVMSNIPKIFKKKEDSHPLHISPANKSINIF
jgi:hypothetical protein